MQATGVDQAVVGAKNRCVPIGALHTLSVTVAPPSTA